MLCIVTWTAVAALFVLRDSQILLFIVAINFNSPNHVQRKMDIGKCLCICEGERDRQKETDRDTERSTMRGHVLG